MGNRPSSGSASQAQTTRPEPQDVGKVVKKAEKLPQIKLPHNYEAILKDANSPIDKSSPDKLLKRLHDKMYWVDKTSNKNCFMLFARDLSITWSEDSRYWNWRYHNDGDVSFDAAELLNVCWLEIHGNFDTAMLSPETLYEAVFVIMLKDPTYGLEVPVNVRLSLPSGNKQEHKEKLMDKPRGQWIEIPAGEFKTSPDHIGKTEISMFEYEAGQWKKGLAVKGIVIRPKN
ncbi:hypothetical protein ACFE04_029595 [Oxalis oulophora]